jgi:hypothetical protein
LGGEIKIRLRLGFDLLAGRWRIYSAAGQGVSSFFTVTK